MLLEDINRIAFLRGIDPTNKSKLELIREIQTKEGNSPCYATKLFSCKNIKCLWWNDCQGLLRSE